MQTLSRTNLETDFATDLNVLLAAGYAEACFAGQLSRRGALEEQGVTLATVLLKEQSAAHVWAHGDGDIDLYVFDRYGVLVAYDNMDSETPTVTFLPVADGEFTIKLVNNEKQPVNYALWADS